MADPTAPGNIAAALFGEPSAKARNRPVESDLLQQCKQFVTYRNDALGHGAQRSDAVYEKDLAGWLPLVRRLLDGVVAMAPWRLCLVTAEDRCQVWLATHPGTRTEPGSFTAREIGHFVVRGPGGDYLDLYPFLCYLPDIRQENRLHYYDSLYRYQATRKEATVMDYDNGERHPRPEPAAGLEETFTAELLAKAFKWHRGRMEIIEGRVANFDELIEAHAAIIGRRFVIDHVRDFLASHDRGLLVIEAQPGKGKTALMAHLIEEVFGQRAPRPVHFFYRRTSGITHPDVCVRSLYAALLQAHGITEAEESKHKNSPEEVSTKLTDVLSTKISPGLLPGCTQLIFIDALDEAEGNAFERIPENLPVGIYVIATTRQVSDRAVLARRQDLHWYDLDAKDLLQGNLSDGFEYAQRELLGTELSTETLHEVARIGAGNFLVLRMVCQHLRTAPQPAQVANLLRQLASDHGKDQLGFIYAEFWDRLTKRCTREDMNLLCDVAGGLVTAHAALSAETICGVLTVRAGDWDFALRHLAEYLTMVQKGEDGLRETVYRVYHESFADFLRAKVETHQLDLRNRFADYCLRWSVIPDGYGRTYALRFVARHLLEAGRNGEAVTLLLDLVFLEAKTEAGMVLELTEDFSRVVEATPDQDSRRRLLQLLEKAIRRDIQFIGRHPSALFQSLWNTCWWHDCPRLHQPHPPLAKTAENLANHDQPGSKLHKLLEKWRYEKDKQSPRFRWIRSLRPPGEALDPDHGGSWWGGQDVYKVLFSPDGRRVMWLNDDYHGDVSVWDLFSGLAFKGLCGHTKRINCLTFSPDGRRLASGSEDKTVRVWDAESLRVVASMPDHEDSVMSVVFSSDGKRVASGSKDKLVRVWNAENGQPIACMRGHTDEVWSVAFSPDGRTVISGSGDKTVRIWETRNGGPIECLIGHSGGVNCVAYSPDGQTIASGSEDRTVVVWDVRSGKQITTLRGHDQGVNRLAFSHDGLQIVSGSWDRKEMACDAGHGVAMTGAVETRDCWWRGRGLIAWQACGEGVDGQLDRTVRVWRVEKGELLEKITGAGDVAAIAAGLRMNPWRAVANRDELVVERAVSGEAIPWIPSGLGNPGWSDGLSFIATHPSGRIWAGTNGGYIFVVKLEGLE
jgi:hypothetical protein